MVMVANLERDEFVYPSNSDDSDFEGTVRSSPDVTSEIFDPPPPQPFSSDSETEIVEETESNPNSDEPNSYGLQETPIYNYSGDHEIEEDFQDGFYWAYLPNKEDTGPEYRPFLGKQQLLLDPYIKDPEYFFHKMFSPSMLDAIAKSTNQYAIHKEFNGEVGHVLFCLFFYPEKRDTTFCFYMEQNLNVQITF